MLFDGRFGSGAKMAWHSGDVVTARREIDEMDVQTVPEGAAGTSRRPPCSGGPRWSASTSHRAGDPKRACVHVHRGRRRAGRLDRVDIRARRPCPRTAPVPRTRVARRTPCARDSSGGSRRPPPNAARRRCNSSSGTSTWMLRCGMSMVIRSPSSTSAMVPPGGRLGGDVADRTGRRCRRRTGRR